MIYPFWNIYCSFRVPNVFYYASSHHLVDGNIIRIHVLKQYLTVNIHEEL